jgi:glycosidase
MLFFDLRSKATLQSLAFASLLGLAAHAHSAPNLKLHVPSPDWRDQIIYFLMTDRFEDGNPQNNDQGVGLYNPQKESHYSGGDLLGVKKRLDYIQGLGATSVWITPPVANQWWNGSYGGYHGYWASDFSKVDAHVGTLKDYQQLSDALHRRGMYLVQDIVLNHTGDFFRYKNWNAQDPANGYEPNAQSVPMKAPLQAPFNLNDPRNPAHRKAGVYHWTPDVRDYNNQHQERNFQMAGLDDLNSESPLVRKALRESYAYWIRHVGVDAFRLDTAFYVPPDAVQDFLYAKDAKHPGIRKVAQQTGRKDFFTFGEGFGIDKAGETQNMRKIESYVRDPKGAPVMQGMLNFPLYGSVGDVMARGRPTQELAARIQNTLKLHSDPHRMLSFIDNHDVDRFLKGANEVALRQSLALIMTLPGIPTLYYGTEQGFKEQRAAMFAKGYASGGVDHFNPQSPLYTYIKSLSALRKQNKVFSRGVPTLLRDDAAGPGVLAYRMDHAGQSAWIVFNTSDQEVLLDNLDIDKDKPNSKLPRTVKGVWGMEGSQFKMPAEWVFITQDSISPKVTLRLPPRSTQIWTADRMRSAGPSNQQAVRPGTTTPSLQNPLHHQLPYQWPSNMPKQVAQDFEIEGPWQGAPNPDIQGSLIINGQLQNAMPLTLSPDGRTWKVKVDTSAWADATPQRLVLLARDSKTQNILAVSEPKLVPFEKQWTLRAEVRDPKGDDAGPQAQYQYPQDPSYLPGTFDMESLEVWEANRSLRLKVKMGALNRSWNPANGFDHVAFTFFIGKPDAAGSLRVMPLQQDTLPNNMHWHYRLRVHGWTNALFGTQGASAQSEGQTLTQTAKIKVNSEERSIQFELPPSLLTDLPSLKGLKIFLNTWDYDSGYRKLSPQGGPSQMGGGQADQPLWMDTLQIELN